MASKRRLLTVMLWTLLTAISSLTIFATSVISAKQMRGGPGSYLLAIAIGAALAVCNAWAASRIATTADQSSRGYSPSIREWCLGGLYFAAILWMPVAAFIGDWATSTVLRLIV